MKSKWSFLNSTRLLGKESSGEGNMIFIIQVFERSVVKGEGGRRFCRENGLESSLGGEDVFRLRCFLACTFNYSLIKTMGSVWAFGSGSYYFEGALFLAGACGGGCESISI